MSSSHARELLNSELEVGLINVTAENWNGWFLSFSAIGILLGALIIWISPRFGYDNCTVKVMSFAAIFMINVMFIPCLFDFAIQKYSLQKILTLYVIAHIVVFIKIVLFVPEMRRRRALKQTITKAQ